MQMGSGKRNAARRLSGGLAFALGALVCFVVPLLAQGPIPAPPHVADPLQTISRWANDYHRLGASLDPAADRCLAPALQAIKSRLTVIDGAENEALIALCDLASIADGKSTEWIAEGRYVADDRESNVREAALQVLHSALDAPSGEGRGYWLATHVLVGAPEQGIPRRIAVAEALIGRHWDSTLLPLFTAAAAPERGLREAAVAALSGWRLDSVDHFLANLTLRALRERDFLSTDALLAHFAKRALPVSNSAAIEVADALARSAISSDWREAVRRIPLSRILPNELAVPHLVEALALWNGRGAAGAPSRRVEAAIAHELELRSGIHVGMSAERWALWWKATRAKDPEAGSRTKPGETSEDHTEAVFFGLHPWTDRVTFVIDRSGSMADPFGTSTTSRYTEALRQLAILLKQLGPRAKFNLILFSDAPVVWSNELKSATPAMIDHAVYWARNLPPRGATFLRPAIARALELDPKSGLPDLGKLESDTVIVLCDGATTEGASWVAPTMRTLREPTCVRFDCVQIGGGGNGTLEALAAESGGEFVRVDF